MPRSAEIKPLFWRFVLLQLFYFPDMAPGVSRLRGDVSLPPDMELGVSHSPPRIWRLGSPIPPPGYGAWGPPETGKQNFHFFAPRRAPPQSFTLYIFLGIFLLSVPSPRLFGFPPGPPWALGPFPVPLFLPFRWSQSAPSEYE